MAELFAGQVMRALLLMLLFVGATGASFVLIDWSRRKFNVRRELRKIGGGAEGLTGATASLVGDRRQGAWSKLVVALEAKGIDLSDSEPDALRTSLKAAGFDSPDAPRLYTFLRLLLVFLLPGTALGMLYAFGDQPSVMQLYIVGSVFGALGLLGPAVYVRMRASDRAQEITNGFPNCLDLMLVCVEAGLGLEAALDRVGREIAEAEPLLSKLLISATLHLRAGASREEALHRMAQDSHVDGVRSFATLLIQSDKLGTSIGTALRVFASEMRERRQMRAEEKAHRLPVLISIPLIVCMLPTMVGVLMLPALIRVVRQIIPALSGG